MAGCDYRLCDVCSSKAFYDANLNYEQERDTVGSVRNAGMMMSNTSLDRLGDWTVICKTCAETHRCVVVPAPQPADHTADPGKKVSGSREARLGGLPPLPKGRLMLSDLQSGVDTVYSESQMRDYAIAAAQPSQTQWQPIETAPKDGTRLLLLFKTTIPRADTNLDGLQFVGNNHGGAAMWSFAAPVGFGGIPDEWLAGWQPLPEPPQAELAAGDTP